MNIAVIGYPYTRPNYRAALEADGVYFILPKIWKIKKGKAEYRTEPTAHILTTSAPLHHSDYPVIGGLLKGWMPMAPFLLWKLKKKHRIELVFEAHEPTLLTTLYHGIFVKLCGLKYAVFSWENIPFEKKLRGFKGMFHRIILALNLALVDGVVCGNQKCHDIFAGLTRKPLDVIPIAGLDVRKFTRSAPPHSHRHTEFVFIGAVDYRKGLHVLIPAFKKLLQKVPDAHLSIVGSGSYEQEIDAMIAECELPITRLPWLAHDKVLQLLEQADVFLYPSVSHAGWEEQFGYSMAEASLMELPVIATQTGSIEELVVDGTTGILVPEQDEEALYTAMLQLADDRALRQRLGKHGREYIISNFSNSVVAQKYKKFFQKIYGT